MTGVPAVDNDHQELVRQINFLEAALINGTGEVQISDALAFLNLYVREHFAREETLMERVRCPASGENCVAHDLLVHRLDEWTVRRDRDGITQLLAIEVHREVSRWLMGHILTVDCKLRPYAAALARTKPISGPAT